MRCRRTNGSRNVQRGETDAGGGADAFEAAADDVQGVFGGIEQDAARTADREAAQARDARGDGDRSSRAMLYDLLHEDLSHFDFQYVPKTDALQEQRQISMASINAWWMDVLHREYVWDSKISLQAEYFGQWHEHVSTDLLYASYKEFAKRDRRIINRSAFGAKMRLFGGRQQRLSNSVVGAKNWPTLKLNPDALPAKPG
jgi:hypothetical protein